MVILMLCMFRYSRLQEERGSGYERGESYNYGGRVPPTSAVGDNSQFSAGGGEGRRQAATAPYNNDEEDQYNETPAERGRSKQRFSTPQTPRTNYNNRQQQYDRCASTFLYKY